MVDKHYGKNMELDNDTFGDPLPTIKKSPRFNPFFGMVAISLVLGLASAFGIWGYLSKIQKKAQEVALTRNVIIAAKEIMSGAKVTAEDLTVKALPLKEVPNNTSPKAESFIGRIPKTTIAADEVISFDKLLEENSPGGITSLIQKDQRAITIRVNDITGVGGFINPGDRVDLLSVVDIGKGELVSKAILQNVLVIAIGELLLDPNSRTTVAAPKGINQVTFALNLNDSEKLNLAAAKGEIRLVLKSFKNKEKEDDFGALASDLYETPETKTKVENPKIYTAPPVIKRKSVEIILGTQRTAVYL